MLWFEEGLTKGNLQKFKSYFFFFLSQNWLPIKAEKGNFPVEIKWSSFSCYKGLIIYWKMRKQAVNVDHVSSAFLCCIIIPVVQLLRVSLYAISACCILKFVNTLSIDRARELKINLNYCTLNWKSQSDKVFFFLEEILIN